jgi:alkylation response protein AidB-like acyl-CoA dehydrogenase
MTRGQYALTEEQELLRATCRQMALERVAPRAAEIDAKAEYPEDMFQMLRQAGLLGLPIPETYGGAGAGWLSACVAVEEFARICYNTAYVLILTWAPLGAILAGGSEEQKARYLAPLARGDWRSCIAVTEPSGGSDVAAMQTRAVRDGDDYVLTGRKCFITGAAQADFMLVFAKTDPAHGARGISGFIVERQSPGLTVGRAERKMGGRGIPSCEVIFEGVRVPRAHLLGPENEGFRACMVGFNRMRPVIGARGVGLAQGALDHAVAFAKERVAFGQPIAAFQGLRWMIADMAMQIEAARHLVYKAAALADAGAAGKELAPLAAMAKCFATDVAMKVAIDACQIFGGYGVLQDYPIERYVRDAKLLQVVEGTNQIQRNIIADAVIGRL